MTAAAAVAIAPDWPALADAYRQAVAAGLLNDYLRRRWPAAISPGVLDQHAIPGLDAAAAGALYRAAGGRHIAQFRANPIAEIRDAVDFLLYDSIKLEERFAECAAPEGASGLAGAGREWPAYLLTRQNPTLFAPWNPHTERALRRWQILPPQLRRGHPGLCYIDLLDILEGLRRRLQLPDFRSVDAFCYLNGRTRRAASITA